MMEIDVLCEEAVGVKGADQGNSIAVLSEWRGVESRHWKWGKYVRFPSTMGVGTHATEVGQFRNPKREEPILRTDTIEIEKNVWLLTGGRVGGGIVDVLGSEVGFFTNHILFGLIAN